MPMVVKVLFDFKRSLVISCHYFFPLSFVYNSKVRSLIGGPVVDRPRFFDALSAQTLTY